MDVVSVVILAIFTTLNLAGLGVVAYVLRKKEKKPKAEIILPHEEYNKPAGVTLPDLHNWPNHPIEIVTDSGTYERWICSNCDSFVQRRKV